MEARKHVPEHEARINTYHKVWDKAGKLDPMSGQVLTGYFECVADKVGLPRIAKVFYAKSMEEVFFYIGPKPLDQKAGPHFRGRTPGPSPGACLSIRPVFPV